MRSALSAEKQGYSEPRLAKRKASSPVSATPRPAASEPPAAAPPPTVAFAPAPSAPRQPSPSAEAYSGNSGNSGNAGGSVKEELADKNDQVLDKVTSQKMELSEPAPSVPVIHLLLRKAGEGPALLAGLQAMGVEVVPHSDGGPIWYWLHVPASMVAELKPYLERYGTLDRQDAPLPTRAANPLSFDLRLNPPAK
jgi:hypothetical protein